MTAGAVGALSRLESLVGPGAFIAAPERLGIYQIDGLQPIVALQPTSAEQVAEIVKFAVIERLAVIPSGARTKTRIGSLPSRYDIALDMTRMNRIAAYDPGDLTLSVEPGLLLHDLYRELDQNGQMLPLGAPFMALATIGGTIASGVDGPMRQLYGTARDFVLGAEFVTGNGVVGKSGGRVVKNVTGYDLHKLMIGSMGALGVLTKINFRTFPAPPLLRAFVVHFDQAASAADFRQAVAASAVQPLTFEIASPSTAELLTKAHHVGHSHALPENTFSARHWSAVISFSGHDSVLDRCETELSRIAAKKAAAHFARIGGSHAQDEMLHIGAVFTHVREFVPMALSASPRATVLKICVLPTQIDPFLCAAKHALDDHSLPWVALARALGVIYVAILPANGSESAQKSVASAARRIQSDVARLEGHATIPWCPSDWKSSLPIWGTQREDLPLMRKVKSVFDPQGIFAPGRLMGGI